MNQFLKAVVIAGMLFLVGLGGCVKPISQNDRMVQWWSMARSSPLHMRYHPDRWGYAQGLTDEGIPRTGKCPVSFHDVIAADASDMNDRPWFPDKIKYGPFTALTNPELEIALLLDEQSQPLWAGAKIIPMHVKGQLTSLVLVEGLPDGRSYYRDIFALHEGDYRPSYRFILLHMDVAQDKLKESPIEWLGTGILTDMVNGDAASYVMDVSGKGDDLLSVIIQKGLGGLEDGRVTDLGWHLQVMDAWGRLVVGTPLPTGSKLLHISTVVKTSPKITISVFPYGDKGDLYLKKRYDPVTFDGRVID